MNFLKLTVRRFLRRLSHVSRSKGYNVYTKDYQKSGKIYHYDIRVAKAYNRLKTRTRYLVRFDRYSYASGNTMRAYRVVAEADIEVLVHQICT